LHLLAAVGAVLGAVDPIWIFFIAPFFGLIWVVVATGLATLIRSPRRELPYGPHLAAATVVVIALRPLVEQLPVTLFPWLPSPGLY
jgi:leader peptidase (prepilin peptidase) / N-methyltransferase